MISQPDHVYLAKVFMDKEASLDQNIFEDSDLKEKK